MSMRVETKIKQKYLAIIGNIYSIAYDKERREFDRIVSLWVYYVTRPISILITPFFIWAKISANQATIIGFLFGLLAFMLSAKGMLLAAAVMYNMFIIVDSVDGNIARLMQSSSKEGEYLDAVTGDIVNYFFIPFMGFGIFVNDLNMDSGLSVRNDYIFIFAMVSSLFYLLSSLIAQRRKHIINTRKEDGPTRLGSSLKPSIFEYIIRNSFSFAFIAPFSIIFAIFNILDLFILYNVIISICITVYTILSGLRAIKKT